MSESTLKSISPARFIHDNAAMLGLSDNTKAAYMTVRELVENSLDSAESMGIQPSIKVELTQLGNKWKLNNSDNGSGIPKIDIPRAFGVVLSSSKYVNKQSRGFLGMGGKGVIQYAYITTQEAFTILSATMYSSNYWRFKMGVDINENKPIIFESEDKPNPTKWHGTVVSLFSKADFDKAMGDIKKYFKLTHLLCPYTSIKLIVNGKEVLNLSSTVTINPEIPMIIPYHPYGIDTAILDDLIKQNPIDIKTFLRKSFQRLGTKTISEFIKFSKFDETKSITSLTKEERVKFVDKMKEFDKFLPPDVSGLAPIGENVMKQGIMNEFTPEYVGYNNRKGVFGGHGFIVESSVAYGGGIDSPNKEFDFFVYRFANKIPLLYGEGSCMLTKTIKEQDFKHYSVDGLAPLLFSVHLCSTRIPHKTLGKEFIGEQPEIKRELDLVLKENLRDLHYFITHKAKLGYNKHRISIFNTYVPVISEQLSLITSKPKNEIEAKLKKVMNI